MGETASCCTLMMLCRGIVQVSSSVGGGQRMTRIRDARKQVLTHIVCNDTTGSSPVCELHALYARFSRECERDVTEWGV